MLSPGDEAERKVALVLEHGLRANRAAAERLLSRKMLQDIPFAGWQQRVEALRMYGRPLAKASMHTLRREIKSALVPRLEFVAAHACDSQA